MTGAGRQAGTENEGGRTMGFAGESGGNPGKPGLPEELAGEECGGCLRGGNARVVNCSSLVPS